MLGRIIGFIITTFLIAIFYGLFVTTVDFFGSAPYAPVASGHRAAANVYGLFGTVDSELARNDVESPRGASIMERVAKPYAVTSDLTAIFAGKVELGVDQLLHGVSRPATGSVGG